MAEHICGINEHLHNFTQLNLHSNVISINVHSNSIRNFAGLHCLSRLKSLDASSNEICDLNTLPPLSALCVLNLACNHISNVHGVEKLQNLLSLNLSYNQLTNLQGFTELHGSECRLETLELHGNKISRVDDIIFNLQGIRSLQHLVLRHDEAHDNPVCNVPDYRKNVLNGLPQLKTLDRRNRNNEIAVPSPDSVLEMLGLDFSLDDIESSDQLSSVSKIKSPCKVTRSTIRTPNIDAVISKVKARPYAQIQSAEDNSIVDSIISSMECNKPTTEEDTSENLISNIQETRLKLLEEQLANLVAARKEKVVKSSDMIPANINSTASSEQCSKIPKQSLIKRSKLKRKPSLENKQTTLYTSAGSTSKHASVQQGPSEKDTYLNLVKELETERERRWKSEQAARRLAQLVRDMSSEKAEGQSLKDMAAQTAERLKQALLGEREESERLKSCMIDLKEKVKELEEQINKSSRTIEEQQSSLRAMEATAAKTSSDRSKIMASQAKRVHECEMRLSAASKETELTKCQNSQLQCRVNELQGLLIKREQEHRKATENLFGHDSMEFRNAVSRELNKEEKRHREQNKTMEQTIASLRQQYGELEDEFRQALHIEADRYEKTKAHNQQCVAELQKVKSSFRVAKDREEKSRSVITELTAVAKEQKIKINELSKNKHELIQQYKERILNLEISAEEGRKKAVQLELIKQEKSRLVSQLAAVQSVVDGLRDERKLWGHELAQQGSSLAQDRGRLESRIETLQHEIDTLKKQNERDLDALKIKSKVVDDQTETIHNMKQALSDKDQEMKRIQEESLSMQRKLEQDMEDLTQDNAALNEQIQALLERKKELKSQIMENEKEFENLKYSHSKLVKKWSEKGQVLSQVEGQVRQMKEVFDEKEKKIVMERDEAIQMKQMLMERMERVDTAFREQLEAANSSHVEEKNRMDRNYHNEIESMKRKVNSVEEEMREVLRDAERQKKSMEVKLQKVTSAFRDLQDGF